MLFDEGLTAFFAELLRVWRLVSNKPESRNSTSFLINSDEGFDIEKVAEVVDKFSKLLGGLDISSKEDDAPRLNRFDPFCGLRGELLSWNSHEEELT